MPGNTLKTLFLQLIQNLREFQRIQQLRNVFHDDHPSTGKTNHFHVILPKFSTFIADSISVQQGKTLAGRSSDDDIGLRNELRSVFHQIDDITAISVTAMPVEIHLIALNGGFIVIIRKNDFKTLRFEKTLCQPPAAAEQIDYFVFFHVHKYYQKIQSGDNISPIRCIQH